MASIDLNKTVYKQPTELNKIQKWYKIDATGKTLGKLAVIVADLLLGKNEAHYCDFWDCGGFVVVENADKISVTGKKLMQKLYYTYSGYKGNVKSKNLQTLLQKKSTDPLWFAVRGMLPKNKLRDSRMKRLKLFTTTSSKYDFLHPTVIN
ncbi:50S ribosomal protein L13 [Patescibacteria group bacterium]|nr:50S ribosomal protein L13 [Patescibacteria group bacterium]